MMGNLKPNKKQKAFMQAYEPLHKDFVRFCKARSHQIMPYQDLVSESVLIAYKNWDKIRKKESLKYFLFTTARNQVLNVLRKKKEVGIEEGDKKYVVNYNLAEKDLEIEFLYNCMAKLSDKKREALILFEITGFSIKEIAEIQESSPEAIKMMLSRARKELKTIMEREAQTDWVK